MNLIEGFTNGSFLQMISEIFANNAQTIAGAFSENIFLGIITLAGAGIINAFYGAAGISAIFASILVE